MSTKPKQDFFDSVLNLALALAYDGLPPGDGGPITSHLSPSEKMEVMYDMEEHILIELTARSRNRNGQR